MKNQGYNSPYFLMIGILFVTLLLISNIIAGKLIMVFGIVLPAAIIIFPLTYIFGDVLTEVYGFKRSRLIIWTGFVCNLIMSVIFVIVVSLPSPDFWKDQKSYAIVLGMTPRIVVASLIAYFAGEFSNSIVLSKMKLLTKGRWLFTRTIGSTVIGEGIDTLFFIFIAFYGLVPFQVLLQMIFVQYIVKVFYEVLATPLTYAIVGWLKKKEKIDTFDWGIKYNPFDIKMTE